jgi:glycosyltransferase involved in cell wall biosynthesis
MKISMIIPTLNRPDDLRRALSSVGANIRLPDEVIIVEQGDARRTKNIASKFELNVQVIYLERKSLASARNIGITASGGDIIMFIDDDVEIDVEYVRNVKKYFETHQEVLGVTGKDLIYVSTRRGIVRVLRRCVGFLFFRSALRGPSRILRSGHNVLHNYADHEERIEWMPGCSFSVRKIIFDKGFRFDERLIGWCFGEDVMFSYAVHKKYPGSLRYVPQVRFTHNASPASRTPNEQKIRMETLYRFMFWKEQVYGGSFLNICCYVWSQVGNGIFLIMQTNLSLNYFVTLCKTYDFLWKNRRKIVSNDIDYNAYILGKKTHSDQNKDILEAVISKKVVTFFCLGGVAPIDTQKSGAKNISFLYRRNNLPKNHSRFFVRTFNTLSDAGKNDHSDSVFLYGESVKLLLFNLPQNASFVSVGFQPNRYFLIALVGLVRRLLKKELKYKGVLTGEKQRWMVFERSESHRKDVEDEISFSFSESVGLGGLARFMNKNSVEYAALFHDDLLIGVEGVHTLDLLVSNKDMKGVKNFLKENPGEIRVNVHSVSRYEGIPYYSPPIAQKIIGSAVYGPSGIKIPAPRESFMSLVYHTLYHKGEKAGIPSTLPNIQVDESPEEEYSQIISDGAKRLGVDISMDMESLDTYLAQQGWRPNLDTLNQISEDNRWIHERFFSNEADEKGLGVLILREIAVRDDKDINNVLHSIEKEGFVILAKRKFLSEERQYIMDNTRGGNWDTKKGNNIEDFSPAMAVVVFDAHQIIRNEFKTNKRLRKLKEEIRKDFHGKNIRSGCSIIHSTDNSLEAWEYIDICFPKEVGRIKKEINKIKQHHKPGVLERPLLVVKFFIYRFKKAVVETGEKMTHKGLSLLVRLFLR